jgi:hypothetical protein
MSDTLHTPGPLTPDGNAVHTTRGECVCLTFAPATGTAEEKHANATLFAASPALLTALETLLNFGSIVIDPLVWDRRPDIREAWQTGIVAVRKAKGK